MYSVCLVDYNGTPASSTPTVVSNELYIYDPITNDEGLVVIDPMLSLEVSKAGSFSCSLPQTNYGFGRIIDKVTRLVVRKNNKIIFIGRINSEDRDLYLTQKIIAEGALAYLNDSLTEKKTLVASNDAQNPATTLFKLLDYIFTNHNNKFPNEPWKNFHLSQANCHADFIGYNSKDVNSNELTQLNLNFDTSLSIVESLLDTANAMLNIEWDDTNNYWEVYIYNKYDTGDNSYIPKTTQPIEFGLNLLDLTQSYDRTDIVTAVAPFGGDLIQESKEIGDIVAGGTQVVGTNLLFLREKDNPDDDYDFADVSNDPVYGGQGYWAYEFDIAGYNALHPDNHINRLYISWRGYKFNTVDEYGVETGYICDCAWRIYDSMGQTLGYHEITKDNEEFESAINEVVDLTEPQYIGASIIKLGGWGGLITPLIRRDATVVESNDKLSIEPCRTFEHEDGLTHPANDKFYLYSDSLLSLYGRIEKKLEYDIDDENKPVSSWVLPYNDVLGHAERMNNVALAYSTGSDGTDKDSYKGGYEIVPFASGYSCIQYHLPALGNSNRPRGVFITSRMHNFGDYSYQVEEEGETVTKHCYVNGMYVVLDSSEQVLAYKQCDGASLGSGFTTIKREYIDLSDAQYFGAEYIRVGGYVGDLVDIECIPSDDTYSANRLMEQAKLYLTSYQWDKIVIEAQAIDLSLTSNEWEALDICKLTEVNSSFHGATFWKPITSLELNLNNFEDNSIKLGYDNNEYMSYQLNESLRLSALEKTIEERRNST